MKTIRIKRIKLINFKGIRNLEVEFNEQLTSIYGRNASGKTTIFDAFTWLLFGKNSDDRKQFGVKTIDKDGNVIPRLPHEVTAELDIDGQLVTITRRLTEKWQKRRGCAEEEFKGNEETRMFNDVPMSVREFSEKINDIVTDEHFKMITNPLYFTSMKWQEQREMLISMAGDVSMDEVIECNPIEFGNLIDSLNGKTLEEYKKEINAKKRRIKEEVDTLPSRIEERRTNDYSQYDFNLLQARLHHKEDAMKRLEEELESANNIVNSLSDDMASIAEKRAELVGKIAMRKSEISFGVRIAEKMDMSQYEQGINTAMRIKRDIERRNLQIEQIANNLAEQKKKREKLLLEWREIKSRQFEVNEDSFVCPTCGRTFEPEQIDEMIEKMQKKFQLAKTEDLNRNKEQGLSVKNAIDYLQGKLDEHTNENERMTKELKQYDDIDAKKPIPLTDEEIEEKVKSDKAYNELVNELAKFDESHKAGVAPSVDEDGYQQKIDELKAKKETLKGEINEIRRQLALQVVAEENEKRIAQLEEELRNASQELARLEGIEYTIQFFTKTRIEMLEEKINSLFTFVKFKMFDVQINGGEVETCKAMVDGIPYDDLNNAMKINAGLDIINAICKSLQITAPLFVDNAESINEPIDTMSQKILLIVSEDEKLRIA